MKTTMHVLFMALMFCASTTLHKTDPVKKDKIDNLNKSGYAYSVNVSKINSKYSEIACTTFRNKLVIVSSKKIGAIGNGIDPLTNEPYTDLFCTDIRAYGKLSQPLLFSRILNTKANEGQVSFSPDEHTIYYTRSERSNSLNYKLYKAELEEDSYGNWINEKELSISNDNYSIESPHVTEDGKYLYFSSNMKGGYGGFDIYRAEIFKDGNIGEPENLGNIINTSNDEKYPHTAKNGNELFFSSKGHNSIGGYDIFISTITDFEYKGPRNLGYSINSEEDEIAFIFVDDKKGVFSSNKENDKNAFNLYRFQSRELYNELKGIVISEEEKILPNSTVILLDNDGNEIERQTTNKDATYNFTIKAYKDYQIKVLREGYEDYTLSFESDDKELKAILKLLAK
ncbi:carboxypeptidase-like regulatory domain-containing protein [Winogradskyella luteola]|uniref:Carboxypeptidase regulatory-like domain-containing protein n=1 Tax=Winogradskyella luteola TaxID=2828330 RepID=A0A9X1F8R5_9FLAO|nr:carboxypeptidase-like regulatory domain-containing protein [Winogradskyella luteola]MBV7269427.1 carboxypeptidase regulatory-like domain-containing protein [Winogradskyella luteola]